MMKFEVGMTEAENGYCYNGGWDFDFYNDSYIEAENEEEAIEFAKQYIIDNGGNADDYIFIAKEYQR